MSLDISSQETDKGQALSFVGPKIWTKICHSTTNVKTIVSFTQYLIYPYYYLLQNANVFLEIKYLVKMPFLKSDILN